MVVADRFQRRFVRAVESDKYDRLALSVPRGNGKSWLAGALCVRAMTPGDRLFAPGCESVLLAASLEQARIVFRFIRLALEDIPSYRFQDSAARVGVVHVPTNTRIRALGSNGKTAMGLGADTALAICDEPGCWETVGGQLLADAVDTALGKVGSVMRVVYIGTVAPALAGGWWPAMIKAGTSRAGRTFRSTPRRSGDVGSVADDPARQSAHGDLGIVPGEVDRRAGRGTRRLPAPGEVPELQVEPTDGRRKQGADHRRGLGDGLRASRPATCRPSTRRRRHRRGAGVVRGRGAVALWSV